MKKISTLFKKDPNDLGRVINEVDPENKWVIRGEGIATRKFDGSACAIISGELYKRYDAKKGKTPPAGAIQCQEPDLKSGHWPHWVKCSIDNPADCFFMDALEKLVFESDYKLSDLDGTYELVSPKVNGNPENFNYHELIPHGRSTIEIIDYSFVGIKVLINTLPYEGIVFHHPDGRMCKIRKCDYGLKR